MTYLRCTKEDCRQVHQLAPDADFAAHLQKAEEGCDECSATPLAIFAGKPSESVAGRFSNASAEERA